MISEEMPTGVLKDISDMPSQQVTGVSMPSMTLDIKSAKMEMVKTDAVQGEVTQLTAQDIKQTQEETAQMMTITSMEVAQPDKRPIIQTGMVQQEIVEGTVHDVVKQKSTEKVTVLGKKELKADVILQQSPEDVLSDVTKPEGQKLTPSEVAKQTTLITQSEKTALAMKTDVILEKLPQEQTQAISVEEQLTLKSTDIKPTDKVKADMKSVPKSMAGIMEEHLTE